MALLTGTEDELLCEVSPVPISGVRQPSEQLGGEAAELLGRRMDGKRTPAAPRWLTPLVIKDPGLVAGLRFIARRWAVRCWWTKWRRRPGGARSLLEQRLSAYLWARSAEYLRRPRLERAKVLLKEIDRAIPDEADAFGFGSSE